MIFIQVILPVFCIFAIGYIGQRRLKLDIKSVSTTALYLMSPVLAFRTFYENKPNGQHLYILIYSLSLCFILLGIIKVISAVKKLPASQESGLMLASAFMNNGNLGVPVMLFAFGKEGFHYAIIIMVFQSFLMSTLGVFIAAKGKYSLTKAIKTALTMPIAYGAVAGALAGWMDWKLPENVMNTVDLLADAAIPTIMLALGMQLSEIKLKGIRMGQVSLALLMRLTVSPVIAGFIACVLPVSPLLREVMIVASAMPTAANTTMYALQFDSEPDFVSGVTFLSTLLSMLTLSILLMILH